MTCSDLFLSYFPSPTPHLPPRPSPDDAPAEPSFQDLHVIGFHSPDDLLTKPILTIRPTTSSTSSSSTLKSRLEKSFSFRLHFCCSPQTFQTHKLSSTSGNLRVHRRPGTGERLPTPRYNCSILEDMYYLRHLQGLHYFSTNLHAPDTFAETCVLLKVWCVRRGYHRERDQMNGFLLTVLLAHLMDTRVVHAHGTPRQMFTTVMDWIATHPFGTWHHVRQLRAV